MNLQPTASTTIPGTNITRQQLPKPQCSVSKKICVVALSCLSFLAASAAFFDNHYALAVRVAVGSPSILIGISVIAAIAAIVLYITCPTQARSSRALHAPARRKDRFHSSFQKIEVPVTPAATPAGSGAKTNVPSSTSSSQSVYRSLNFAGVGDGLEDASLFGVPTESPIGTFSQEVN